MKTAKEWVDILMDSKLSLRTARELVASIQNDVASEAQARLMASTDQIQVRGPAVMEKLMEDIEKGAQ